jgi:hypothetical protein
MAGHVKKRVHEHILGGVYIALTVIARAVSEPYIQPQRILKIMPKISVELLIVVHIICHRYETKKANCNDQV